MLAILGARMTGPELTSTMGRQASAAIAAAGGKGVKAHFETNGWPSRHVLLSGGGGLSDAVRARVARAVAGVPGVGGVFWSDGSAFAMSSRPVQAPLHCEEDVAALLRSRTIRFEESSARIDAASRGLIDEVAEALRPCLGSIISITGHTDSSGPEPGNLALSRERANAVMAALEARGIPDDGLRARGVGSAQPVEGLDPADPANRRIEFAVVESQAIKPTPVDTPGPR